MTLHYYVLGGTIIAGILALIPIFYTLAPIYPWTYTNARVKSMHKKLIQKKDLEGYLLRPYEDIIYDLEERFIPKFSKYLSANFTYAAVDNALRQHFIETAEKLIRITPQEQNDFLKTYLKKFETRIIKNIVRSLSNKDSKRLVLPKTQLFSKAFKNKDNPTLNDLERELQGTPYQKILEEHKQQILEKNYLEFERALNRLYLNRLKRAATTQHSRNYVKKNIDKLNIQTWIKKGEKYLEGGTIPKETYNTNKYEKIQQKYSERGYSLPKNPLDAENYLKQDIQRYAESLRVKDPHSEASTISYLIKKAHNVQQLNILLKLKYHNTPQQKIKEALQL